MASQKVNGASTERLWGGRFTGGTDPLMAKYNDSLPFDKVFYRQDIAGSIAFARANVKTGILTREEFQQIEKGLLQVQQEWASGAFQVMEGDEDIHTANERRLGEIIGKKVAGKLHTGRSRNDQVATDIRLWLRDELREMGQSLHSLLQTIAARAEQDINHLMPGYTHLQRAQPIRWSHWLLSYASFFAEDMERLLQLSKRTNKCPLGCGALAGNAFGIDRVAMAEELGFDEIMPNSMAAVADRDPILEMMQWSSMLMLHISRISTDLIDYSTAEFGFVRLADAYTTGSSLMPQKKNADSLELLRGKSGRVCGAMVGLMMSIKGLPSTYNKDLQESLEPGLETIKTIKDSLVILDRVLRTLTIFPEKMRAALTPDMLATDLAEHLVRAGIPFRETHHIAGRVVKLAEDTGVSMDKLSFEQLRGVDPRFEPSVLGVFDYEHSVEHKSADGGTSRAAVERQLKHLVAKLKGWEQGLEGRK